MVYINEQDNITIESLFIVKTLCNYCQHISLQILYTVLSHFGYLLIIYDYVLTKIS